MRKLALDLGIKTCGFAISDFNCIIAKGLENYYFTTKKFSEVINRIKWYIYDSEYKNEIDEIISNNLKDWKLERLSKMDRQILRISAYEILYSDIPYKVSINEAVELSKKYSEKDDSYKFINGVLKGIVETSTK